MPMVTVEFFGIPRVRAGVAAVAIDAADTDGLLRWLATEYPEFGKTCLARGRLRPEYLLNINGRQFTREHDIPLHDGDTVLILSADVGG